MFSPLFFVLMSGVQQKSSVPCPISQAKGTKLLILSSAVPPGFHPCTDAGRLSERRNGAWPFCTTAVSHRPLRSELQPARTRKPFQPVKLLSLPCGADLLSPSLRLGVFRFITVCILPHFAEVCKGCARSFRKCRTQPHFSDRFILPLSTAHKSHCLPARVQKSPTAAFLLPRWSAHPCNRPRS